MLASVMQKIQTVLGQQTIQEGDVWVQNVWEINALDTLVSSRKELAEIDFTTAEDVRNKLVILLDIDKKNYQSSKKLTHKYLNKCKNNKNDALALYKEIYGYQIQLYQSYKLFFTYYEKQTRVKLSVDKFALILARLLNAAFTVNKWSYFEDQPAPNGVWETVHKVIKAAENSSVMNKVLFLYDFQVKETSVASLLKRGFMMDTLHKSNFTRLQIQIVEQVLKIWSTNPIIVNHYKQDRYQFYIALTGDSGPQRIRAIEPFADCRFWKSTRLVDLIEDFLCAVNTKKSLEPFGLQKVASTTNLVTIFKKLRAEWCVEGYSRQRRQEVRVKNHKLLNVSHGVESILERLRAMEKALPKAENVGVVIDLSVVPKPVASKQEKSNHDITESENWLLVDESQGGFGVNLGKVYSSWIEAGVMLGFTMPENKSDLAIAQIKSVRKQKDGSYRAGVRLLSKRGQIVHACCLDRLFTKHKGTVIPPPSLDDLVLDTHALNQLKPFEALYIHEEANPEAGTSIILPRLDYNAFSYYLMNIGGKDHKLKLGRQIQASRDWVRVEVSI